MLHMGQQESRYALDHLYRLAYSIFKYNMAMCFVIFCMKGHNQSSKSKLMVTELRFLDSHRWSKFFNVKACSWSSAGTIFHELQSNLHIKWTIGSHPGTTRGKSSTGSSATRERDKPNLSGTGPSSRLFCAISISKHNLDSVQVLNTMCLILSQVYNR